MQFVQEADDLLVFDAIDYGLVPGTLKLVQGDEVPKFTGAKKMSLHQTGFQEVLSSAADLMGDYPDRLALIGCQPLDLEDWGGPLTAPVRDRNCPGGGNCGGHSRTMGRPLPPPRRGRSGRAAARQRYRHAELRDADGQRPHGRMT